MGFSRDVRMNSESLKRTLNFICDLVWACTPYSLCVPMIRDPLEHHVFRIGNGSEIGPVLSLPQFQIRLPHKSPDLGIRTRLVLTLYMITL
jgi:hypothetical protein